MLNFHRSSNKVLALLLSVSVVTPVFAHFSSTEKAELLEYAKMSTSIILENDTLSIYQSTPLMKKTGLVYIIEFTPNGFKCRFPSAEISWSEVSSAAYCPQITAVLQQDESLPPIKQDDKRPSNLNFTRYESIYRKPTNVYINTSSIIVYGNDKKILAHITPNDLLPCSMETIYNIFCTYLNTAQKASKN